METVVSYIVKSIIASGILLLYYYVILRDKKFHAYNRFYLLISMSISLIAPFVNIKWFTINEPVNKPLNNFLYVISSNSNTRPVFHFTAAWILLTGAIIISFILLAILFSKIIWIYHVKRRHATIKMQGIDLIQTNLKQAPFSFFNNLFWKQSIAINEVNGQKIFKHELTHIKEKHTHDNLFFHAITCVFWMNPFYWIMQRELNMIHEFIADERSVDEGDVRSFAEMLLQSYNEGRYLDPSHSFFHSPIKRRLIMITKSRHTPYSYARRILALPVITLVVALFSVTISKAQTDPKKDPGPLKINSIKMQKKAGSPNAGDSLVDITVAYVKRDGSKDTLRLMNVGYSKNDSAQHKAQVILEDGTKQELTPDEVRHWVEIILQNPPDVIYYLNGIEITKGDLLKLEPSKIKTANVLRGDEAVAKYGEKARKGIILFTTE